MEILEAKFFKKCNFFLGKSMSKFMSNDVRSPAADRRSSKTLFSKRIYSALVIRLLFNILKKYSYHVFPCKESEKFHQKNYQTLNFFSPYFLQQTDFSNSTKAIERLAEQSANVTYECYENFTIYYPLYNNAKFWIEGVLLILVGTLGLFGNFLTLAVLSQSKKSTFNQLLIALSICDRYL